MKGKKMNIEVMQKKLLRVLKNICGEPVYKAICKDSNGNEVARPVFTIPKCHRKKELGGKSETTKEIN